MDDAFIMRRHDTNKIIKCIKCNKRILINNSHICYYCYGMNSLVVNSGNVKIDNFIKGTHKVTNSSYTPYLMWVPFNEFTIVKKIGQGGFGQIYKAAWDIEEGISRKGSVKRLKGKKEIVLKILNNSQNVDIEFLNEVISHISF